MKKTEIFHYLCIALAALAAIVVTIYYPVNNTITIEYEVKDLGTPRSRSSTAYGINDLGQVVGTYETRNGKVHAFIWDENNGMQDLTPGGNFNADAKRINNLGQLTANVGYGWSRYPHQYRQGFLWDKTDCFPLQNVSYAFDINDRGQIVGIYNREDSVLWNSPGDLLNLKKTLGFAYATRINNAGQIIGRCECPQKLCDKQACLWDSKQGIPSKKDVTYLGFLSGKYSQALGINDLGQVVGESSITVERKKPRAFIWDITQGMRPLGTFKNTIDNQESSAKDINNFGQVVGFVDAKIYSGDAFLWDRKNGMRNLNDLIDPNSGWHLDYARSINDKGRIVGRGYFNGETHAFLLKPISHSDS